MKGINTIYVATDHQEIFQTVADMTTATPVMTPSELASGSDRVAYVAKDVEADIVVNLQGDEPLFDITAVQEGLDYLEAHPNQMVVTLAAPLNKPEDWQNPNVVKVLVDNRGRAIYFSRSPVPFFRDSGFRPLQAVGKHVGIYIFRKEFLLAYSQMPVSELESAEKLEQLRLTEAGFTIQVVRTKYESVGVDCPDDLELMKKMIKKRE